MRQYTAENLIVRPAPHADPQVLLEVTPDLAGWEFISFQVRRIPAGSGWSGQTGDSELALVLLGGTINVESSRGSWQGVGGRANVFAGPPHALYLPPHTHYMVCAPGGCEVAVASAPAAQDHPPRLITPADVTLEIRGGDNATRQINGIIPPGFPCQRLVVVEVYTPGGSWSSYPPHKHDLHREVPDGTLIEADLEEVYFYKIDPPGGFAYQRIYTDERSPLHRAGLPIDALLLARDGDAVLVPEGYHPVVSAPGYTTYYLNILAGSAQSLANVDDPQHSWVKDSYHGRDHRVPIYPVGV
ncbi:MAG: 5-deoxy-glucuronate isomerase [Oscillochloris sp.]|nr:5-deoxy-glucuronate isomerase [Oscillochloris sp.]